MPSSFPGMDPHLENPEIWSGVHAAFLAAVQEALGVALRPKYVVRFEERVYRTDENDPAYRVIVPDVRVIERAAAIGRLIRSPSALAIAEPIKVPVLEDPEIHEPLLQILDPRDRSVVTVIELLSPTNKTSNSYGRESFLRKRRDVIAAGTNWVEIDLLRAGERTTHLASVPETEYRVYVSRGGALREAFAWPITLRQPLPIIGIPLRAPDSDAPLDLQDALRKVIERGSYDLDLDYAREAEPPLQGEVAAWTRGLFQNHSARPL